MTGSDQQRFRRALDGAFDDQSLSLLITDYFAPKALAKIAAPGTGEFEFRLYLLIDKARMEGWLPDLVAAAHERRPKDPALAELASRLGLTSTGPNLVNLTGKSLEALVQTNAKFINPAQFMEALSLLEKQVCWMEIPGGGGSGFLVAPDLVVTNHHVIRPVLDRQVGLQDVKVRFDYRKAADGTVLKKQKVAKLHPTGWLRFERPPNPADWGQSAAEAGPEEVDCALIRLEDSIGDLPAGGFSADAQALPRGWVKTKDEAPTVSAGNQVFLMTHPKGEPLQLSIGTVKGFNGARTRVRYDANSMEGSSGSPVFDADLKLIALHHATDPTGQNRWNQGVPFRWIQELWKREGISPEGLQ